MTSSPALWPAVVAAVVAVVGAAFALWTQSLPRMVVSLMAAVVGACGVGFACGGVELALVVGVGGAGLVIPAAAAVVVVDLDGRGRRTLRPWKLLLLAPLPLVGVALWPRDVDIDWAPPAADGALSLALLGLAAAVLSALLLVRRPESPS